MESNILEKSSKIKEIKDEVKIISSNISNVIRELDPNHSLIAQSARLEKLMNESKLVISVVGEFSRGKSCFINSLLGKEILPEDMGQTTAAITFIQYGDKPRLEINYRDKRPSLIYDNIKPDDFTQLLKEEITQLSKKYSSPAEVIEDVNIFYNSHILKAGIKIVDTPGISGLVAGHTEMTEYQVQNSNAAICLFSFLAAGGDAHEVEFLKFVKEEMNNDTKKLLYIANQAFLVENVVNNLLDSDIKLISEYKKINNIPDDEEILLTEGQKNSTKQKAFNSKIEEYLEKFKETINTHIGLKKDEINIFAYDSKWAISDNKKIKEKSNFLQVTKHIDEVLTSSEEILKAHISDPVQKINKILDETNLLIIRRLSEYENKDSLNQLNEKLKIHQDKEGNLLEKLENQKNSLKQSLNDLSKTFNYKFERNILKSFDDLMISYEKKCNDIESEEDIKDLNKDANSSIEQINKEFAKYLEETVKDEIETKLLEYETQLKSNLEENGILNSDNINNLINDLKVNFNFFESINFNKLSTHIKTINNTEKEAKEIEKQIYDKQKQILVELHKKEETQKQIDDLKFKLEKKENDLKFIGSDPSVEIIPGGFVVKPREGFAKILDFFLDPLKKQLPDKIDNSKLKDFLKEKNDLKNKIIEIENKIDLLKKDNPNIDLIKQDLDIQTLNLKRKKDELDKNNQKVNIFWKNIKDDLKLYFKNKLKVIKDKMENTQKQITTKSINSLASKIETETIKSIKEALEDQTNEIKRLKDNIEKSQEDKDKEISKINSLKDKLKNISMDISNINEKSQHLIKITKG